MYMYHIYIKLSLQSYNQITLITFYTCLSNTLRTPLHSRLIHLGYVVNHYPTVTISMTTVIEIDRCYTDVHRNAAVMYIIIQACKNNVHGLLECIKKQFLIFFLSYNRHFTLFKSFYSFFVSVTDMDTADGYRVTTTSCTRTSRPMTST